MLLHFGCLHLSNPFELRGIAMRGISNTLAGKQVHSWQWCFGCHATCPICIVFSNSDLDRFCNATLGVGVYL